MKRILWILAIVIIPAFVLWGAAGLMERGKYAGVIFGKKVSFQEYEDSYTAARNLAILMYGSKFNEMQDQLNLEEAAWDRLIMLREAKMKGVRVSDAEIIARIASMGVFQAREGGFDQRNYAMILGNILRTTPRAFEEQVRESLMIERLIMQAFSGIPEPTEEEIQEAMKLAPEKPQEGKEAKIERPEEKRERAKAAILMAKRMDAYKAWHDELYKKANLISNIERQKEEIPEEKPAEEKPATTEPTEVQAPQTPAPSIPASPQAPPAENTPQTENTQQKTE